MTEKKVACCGLTCTDCPAFIALADDVQELREKTAKEWSELYGADIKAEDIQCTGCEDTDEIKFHHCYECEIRRCAHGKHFSHCSECGDYACDILNGIHGAVPDAKKTLDEM